MKLHQSTTKWPKSIEISISNLYVNARFRLTNYARSLISIINAAFKNAINQDILVEYDKQCIQSPVS